MAKFVAGAVIGVPRLTVTSLEMETLITRGSRPPQKNQAVGGRVCSLNYRPRRWFGYRLEQVLSDFLATEEAELGGLSLAIVDLLRGTVRADLDERVLVSAHHCPDRGRALVTVTLFYRLPSVEDESLGEVLMKLGRKNISTLHYRLSTEHQRPVRARLKIRSTVIGNADGESSIVTTFTATARTASKPVLPENLETKTLGVS